MAIDDRSNSRSDSRPYARLNSRSSTRRRLAAGLLTLSLSLLASLFSPPAAAATVDPWYRDLGKHWARGEIRVLWMEELTDGDVRGGSSRFKPDGVITRAQMVMMLAKAFRLDASPPAARSFRDLGPDYEFFNDKRPFPYVEAAYRAGIAQGYPGGYFRPDDGVRRDHAFALLIRSLGLGETASQFPPDKVELYLARFRDGRRIDPSVRNEVALAVYLGIAKGYPDGTLKPSRLLSRAEGAVIIYRSCLYNLTASPNPFYPDGDGFKDVTDISIQTLKNQAIRSWSVSITNSQNQTLREFGPEGPAKRNTPDNPPPPILSWDGTGGDGRPLPPGTYFYGGWARDRTGRLYRAVKKPITLGRRSLSGYLYPDMAAPGETVSILAWTAGGATAVTASLDSVQVSLRSTGTFGNDGHSWKGSFRVPSNMNEGTYPVDLRAFFQTGYRWVTLSLRVRKPLFISPSVDPNPARAGSVVSLNAETSHNANRVAVTFPWGGRVSLTQTGPGMWHADHGLSTELERGTYPVEFTAGAPVGEVRKIVNLVIEGSILDQVLFSLTDS